MFASTALLLAAKIAETYSKNDDGKGLLIFNEIKLHISEGKSMEKFWEILTKKVGIPVYRDNEFRKYSLESILRSLANTQFID